MLSIKNLHNSSLTAISVKHAEQELEFTIGTLISKKNKEELDNDVQFVLFNSYLDYKGDTFKDIYFDALKKADMEINWSISKKDIHPLPYQICHTVLDLFDIQDVLHFVKNVYKVIPPPDLLDTFSDILENDGRYTRVQTYLKEDYLELAALSLVIKATLGPVGHFGYIKNKEINSTHAEYILFHFYITHPVYKTPAMQKMLGLVNKLVYLPSDGTDVEAIRILEKQISKDEMPIYILAIVIMQKITIAPIITDHNDRNIVTKIYTYINNRLKSSGGVSKSIRNKNALTDSETGGSEQESFFESYRIMEEIAVNYIVEYKNITSNTNMVFSQFSPAYQSFIDAKLVTDAIQFTKVFENGGINKTQINLIAWVNKSIIDPRALDYLPLANIINLMAVTFALLHGLGYKHLALLLTSRVDDNYDEVLTINSTVNRNRVPKELKAELDIIFPYHRVINDTTTVNVVEESVNTMANTMFDQKWIPNAYESYVVEALGHTNINKILPTDLKIQLTEMLIRIERI